MDIQSIDFASPYINLSSFPCSSVGLFEVFIEVGPNSLLICMAGLYVFTVCMHVGRFGTSHLRMYKVLFTGQAIQRRSACMHVLSLYSALFNIRKA